MCIIPETFCALFHQFLSMAREGDELIFTLQVQQGLWNVRRPAWDHKTQTHVTQNPPYGLLLQLCVCVDWDEEGGKNSRPNLRLGAELRCWQWPFNLQVTASFWSGKIPEKNKGRESVWNRRTRIWSRRCKWKSFILPPLSQSLLPSLSFFFFFFQS